MTKPNESMSHDMSPKVSSLVSGYFKMIIYLLSQMCAFASTRCIIELLQFYRGCNFAVIIMMYWHGITKIKINIIKVTML